MIGRIKKKTPRNSNNIIGKLPWIGFEEILLINV